MKALTNTLVADKLINGTSLRGYLPNGTDYREIVEVFGQPTYAEGDRDKTKCEWVVLTPLGVATIYDYRSYLEPYENGDWHIGAKDIETADWLINYFKEQVNATA